MKVLYFAWVRERLGRSEEELNLPANVRTARQLAAHLHDRGGAYAMVFGELSTLNLAIDQEHATWDSALGTAREVAFFPPVTGG
ncbi:MAG: molybdopterin converting factor subunit 1 [Alphaproteobacteria bacterium]|nr:molybdopterin converting factor subunit 1 [Alphaproteobacteria bacterium]